MPKLNRNLHSFKNGGRDLRSRPWYLCKTRFAWFQNFQCRWCDFDGWQTLWNGWCGNG